MKEIIFNDIPLKLLSKESLFKQIDECVRNKLKAAILCSDYRLLRYNNNTPIEIKGNFIFYPDSTGIFIILKTLWNRKVKYFKKLVSTDIHFEILTTADQNNYNIFLFGDTTEVLEQAVRKIQKEHKNIRILGYQNGFNYTDEKLINKINELKPDLLLVGMGVPKQELWVIKNYPKLTTCVIITVGAFFSFYSGKIKRAPKVFRTLSLEWLFRIFQEPFRLVSRYFIEFPLFLYISVKKRIEENDSTIYP